MDPDEFARLVQMEEAHFFMAPEWARVAFPEETPEGDKPERKKDSVQKDCNIDAVTKAEEIPQENSAEGEPMESPPPSGPNIAFWTECNYCKAQLEYQTVFMNKNLRCWFCKNPFRAAPTTTNPPTSQRKQNVTASTAKSIFATRGRKRTTGIQIVEKSCEESVTQGAAKGKGVSLASNEKSKSDKGKRPMKMSRLEAKSDKGKRPLKMSRLEANVTLVEERSQLETGSVGASSSTKIVRVSRSVRISVSNCWPTNANLLANRSRMEIRAKLQMEKSRKMEMHMLLVEAENSALAH